MDVPASLLPEWWYRLSFAMLVPVVFWIVRTAAWRALAASNLRLNLLFGFAVSLAWLWSMRAGVLPGLNFHLLGAMAACLVLGPRLAIIALGLALCGITLNGVIEWKAWPLNFLLMAVLPVFIAHGLARIINRALPAHFFIFIYAAAFAGSAATVVLQGFIASGVMVMGGAYTWSSLSYDYLPYLILLGFSEAWIAGAVITLLVVYKPGWVEAFDDQRYLANR